MSANLRRWLTPDISLVLSLIVMLYCLTSFDGMRTLFRDSDSGWHIINGQRVMATGMAPQAEPFSFSKPGGAWFAWEWLADVVMAWAHGWDGMRGVFFLYLFTLGAVTWLWFRLVWAQNVWFLLGVASTWLMLTTTNIHWLARPHLFSWVFLLLALLVAEHAPERLNWRWVVGVAVGGVLWANIHGSFFVGVLIFALYAGQAAWERSPKARAQAVFAGLTLAASFVNPYGWHVHEHIVNYLQDKELLSRVGEFQTFNFHTEGAEALVVAMVVAAAGISLNVMQGQYARGVLCLILFAGALRSARGLPMLALLALPLALGAICRVLEGLPWLDAVRVYNRNLRAMEAGFRGYLLMPLVAVGLLWLGRSALFPLPAGFPAAAFPVKLSEEVAKLGPEARIFSTDKFGGYLIYRFAGERKVFFDGRSDYYGAQFLKDYLLLPDGKPGWREQWARWGFTHALLPKEAALNEVLPMLGWTRVGSDEAGHLYAAPEGVAVR
jgi:hypothetical protein